MNVISINSSIPYKVYISKPFHQRYQDTKIFSDENMNVSCFKTLNRVILNYGPTTSILDLEA